MVPGMLRRLPLMIAVSAVALVSAACGSGGDSTAQVASLNSSGGSSGSATATTTSVNTEEALLAYAQCMRDNGVDMKDPTVDADGNIQGGFGPDSGIDPRSTEFQDAQAKCGDKLQGITLGGGRGGGGFDRTAIQDGLNQFTACLRDQGLTVDDITLPERGQGGPPSSTAGGGSGAASGPAGGPPGSDGGGFNGGPPGSRPAGGGGADFDPTARFVERLGLDTTDPTVSAAIATCKPVLETAFTAARNATTTTVAGG